jgi:hypothetical protein
LIAHFFDTELNGLKHELVFCLRSNREKTGHHQQDELAARLAAFALLQSIDAIAQFYAARLCSRSNKLPFSHDLLWCFDELLVVFVQAINPNFTATHRNCQPVTRLEACDLPVCATEQHDAVTMHTGFIAGALTTIALGISSDF